MAVNKMNRKVNLKSKTNRSVLKSNKTKKVSKTMNGGSKCGSNIMKGGSKSVKRKVSRKKIESSRFRTLKKGKKELKRVRQNRTQKKGLKNKKYRTLKKKVTGGGKRNSKQITTKKDTNEDTKEDTKEDEIELQDIDPNDVNTLLKNEGEFLLRKIKKKENNKPNNTISFTYQEKTLDATIHGILHAKQSNNIVEKYYIYLRKRLRYSKKYVLALINNPGSGEFIGESLNINNINQVLDKFKKPALQIEKKKRNTGK